MVQVITHSNTNHVQWCLTSVIHWKLGYSLCSLIRLFLFQNNAQSELGEQLYNIQLACEDETQKVNFVCTLQELEELVTGFKHMAKHVQNLR